MNLANADPARPDAAAVPGPTDGRTSTVSRLARAGLGALLGALAGFLVVQLVGRDIFGGVKSETIVVTCLGLGAVVGGIAGSAIVVVIDAVLMLAFLFVAYAPVFSSGLSPWVRADSLPPAADAVVVLSSTILSDSAVYVHGLDRLLTAVDLMDRGVAPRIVTSRVAEPFSAGSINSDADQRRVLTLGHATRRWDVVDSVHSTHDEAVHIARLLLPQGARSIVLVTSPMHTRRACATFEAVGFKVVCRPAREHHRVTWHPDSPSDQLAAFRDFLYERLGMVKYRYKGWLPAGQ